MNPGGAPEESTLRTRSRGLWAADPSAVADESGPSNTGSTITIERPRLHSAPWTRLLLVTAPAGYGKTVLLKQIWAGLPADAFKVWLSLGPAQRDFDVFLRDISAALQAQSIASPAWRGDPEEMGARLAHGFASGVKPLFLFLDDYHAAASPELDSFVRSMAGSSAMHLVIATRTHAKIGAAVLSARGDLTLIGAADLAFSLEEARRLLENQFTSDDAAALHAETDGWPAALKLASRTTRSQTPGRSSVWPLSATSGEVGALLEEETFDVLPEALQTLLVETAYLETLSPEDVDAVRGRGDSAGLMADLERSAALVVPDRERPGRLRRHPLLLRFLEARFALLNETRRTDLSERTMACLTRSGDVAAALRLERRRSPMSPSLASLEQAPAESFWSGEALLNLPRNLLDLEETAFASAPHLVLARGLAFFNKGQMADARVQIVDGLSKLRAEGNLSIRMLPPDKARDWSAWSGLRAAIFDETISDESLEGLISLTSQTQTLASLTLPAHAASVLALRAGRSEEACVLAQLVEGGRESSAARVLGGVQEAVASLYDASPQRAAAALSRIQHATSGHSGLEAARRLCTVWLAYERGQAWRDSELPSHNPPPPLLGLSPELFVERTRLAASRALSAGGVEAAKSVLQDGRAFAEASGWRRADAVLEAETLKLFARSGVRTAAVRALAESIADKETAILPEVVLALARFDFASGAHKRARARLAAMMAAPALARRWHVEALLVDAHAACALGLTEDVNSALEQYLDMSRESVLARCFHEDGVGLWEPLMALASKKANSEPEGVHLDVVADLAVTRPFFESGAALEPPTEQESQMFAALKRTGSRGGAANDLAMSENTLKYYLKRVFEKWRVRDWRLAMRIAEKLNS